jgi:L-iditol 2-dehydrogenase
MKALVLKEYKKFSLEQRAEPTPGPGEVLVAVKACGICGSDVHGMDGSTGRRRPPIVMGHEASGVIAAAGLGVKNWRQGDRVTLDSTVYCGECEFCRRGQINLCNNRRVLGVSCEEYRRDGAFADFVAVPQHILYRLPDALSYEHAALVEPFTIALHGVRRTKVLPADTVVVVGAGMIGLALAQVLRATGCGRIIAVDVAPDRLALAQTMGATHTVNSAAVDATGAIADLTGGGGADAAFEAVGLTATVDLSVRCLRKGGSAVLVGNFSPKIELPLQVVVTRELSVYGSCASSGEYPDCLEMMANGKLRAEPLISAAAPLEQGPEWFDRLYRKEPGLLKVVLKP